eukprot:Selendium_serpulae@DN3956_c0_g1_i2.p1
MSRSRENSPGRRRSPQKRRRSPDSSTALRRTRSDDGSPKRPRYESPPAKLKDSKEKASTESPKRKVPQITKKRYEKHRSRSLSSDSGSSDSSESDRGRSKDRSKASKKRKKKDSKKRSSRRSPSTSSSSGSSDSSLSAESSSDSDDRRKKKKHKKKRSKSKDRSKSKRRDKKQKKDKSSKKKAKRKAEKDPQSKNLTDRWGKYGFLQEHDRWAKKPEFQIWLLEVKQKHLEEMSQFEERQFFKEYMEDFNTATFPSKKYYSLAEWERKESLKSHARKEKELLRATKVGNQDYNALDDERNRKFEIERIRDDRRQQAVADELAQLKGSDKLEAMQHQKDLKDRMQVLFKMGRVEEALKIQELLAPDEEWAVK